MAENDFTERLNQLLSNPESLAQVMSLAKNFMPPAAPVSAQPVNAQPTNPQPVDLPVSTEPDYPAQESPPANPPVSGAGDIPVGAIFNQLMSGGPPKHHHEGDRRILLLKALKPYLKHDRADKIDMLLKVLQISELAQSAFGGRY